MPEYLGNIEKMRATLAAPVQYALPIGDFHLPMNELIGQRLTLVHTGRIYCVACGRLTKKSFNQGYCYPCFTRLAQCDSCIVKPELCHFAAGTCREPEWGMLHCMIPHVVYLANSSGLKVGITRHNQVPTRWLDQGATQALPILSVQSRYQSGLAEVIFKDFVADKTDWRAMLKAEATPMDLPARRDELLGKVQSGLASLRERFGSDAVVELTREPISISYPVQQYPTKVSSFDFDKTPEVTGLLQGIKGQYLIFDTGVINLRKFGGYELRVVA
ncbi:DUF2797 domain-containing protein [Permianibacter sp. IMCC34836]|nr:DUF2797 domain-containing protein [Permianibacter fluminis]NQD37604.1 DUF2797 domain-containing protein [Permianibacter fluminis]